ncbi:putative gustatory receptor 36b [Drosophila ficusphila]|uniref:putative gustatory receptor 36b n=1 Tax=Drosophila ficusphila TaxID=30025 RepID=UPI001C8909A1|nr:putative gustatory receptor 36b [Drosophila ficusphila]
MVDGVRLLLRAVNFYSHLIGLNNFVFDTRTGRVFTTWITTIYPIGINVVITTAFIFCCTQFDFVIVYKRSLTMINRWRQRKQLMHLTRKFLCLLLAHPQVKGIQRFWLFSKIFIGLTSDFSRLLLAMNILDRVSNDQTMKLFVFLWSVAITNLAIMHYHLLVLFVQAQYQHLNNKLRQIIQECETLKNLPQRRGTVITRCCDLSDQLEDIAKTQSRLQYVFTSFTELLAIQGAVVICATYISIVINIYLLYYDLKYGQGALTYTIKFTALPCTCRFLEFLDSFIKLSNTFSFIDEHEEMKNILEKKTLFASRLDERLEQSFESLQLQLIRNPLKLEVLGLFDICRSSTFASFGSIIMHSIFLIQYDLEHF